MIKKLRLNHMGRKRQHLILQISRNECSKQMKKENNHWNQSRFILKRAANIISLKPEQFRKTDKGIATVYQGRGRSFREHHWRHGWKVGEVLRQVTRLQTHIQSIQSRWRGNKLYGWYSLLSVRVFSSASSLYFVMSQNVSLVTALTKKYCLRSLSHLPILSLPEESLCRRDALSSVCINRERYRAEKAAKGSQV